jgi:hypothetical protein
MSKAGPKSKSDAMSKAGPLTKSGRVASVGESAATAESVELKSALTRLGLTDLSDEIMRQVKADEGAAPAASHQLSVWSCTVSPSTIERDALGQVLQRNRVQVLGEETLDSTATTAKIINQNAAAADQLFDVVLVTATPGQLGATLAEIRSQSATFQNLTHLGRHRLPGLPPERESDPFSAIGNGLELQQQRSTSGGPAAANAPDKQAGPDRMAQQAATGNNRASRAVRLRFSNRNAPAMQNAQPASGSEAPASEPHQSTADQATADQATADQATANQASRKQESTESTDSTAEGARREIAAEQRSAKADSQVAPLERALFILRCPDPPSAGAPLPAKAK